MAGEAEGEVEEVVEVAAAVEDEVVEEEVVAEVEVEAAVVEVPEAWRRLAGCWDWQGGHHLLPKGRARRARPRPSHARGDRWRAASLGWSSAGHATPRPNAA